MRLKKNVAPAIECLFESDEVLKSLKVITPQRYLKMQRQSALEPYDQDKIYQEAYSLLDETAPQDD